MARWKSAKFWKAIPCLFALRVRGLAQSGFRDGESRIETGGNGGGGIPEQSGNYNIWSCPHCYGGSISAEVADLTCENIGEEHIVNWRHVKDMFHQLLRNLDIYGPEEEEVGTATSAGVQRAPGTNRQQKPPQAARDINLAAEALDALLPLARATPTTRCYLGMVCLAYLNLYTQNPDDRRQHFKETYLGAASFKKLMPLSTWDILLSGWPTFAMLDLISQVAHLDKAMGVPPPTGMGSSGMGMDVDEEYETAFAFRRLPTRIIRFSARMF